MVLLNGWRWNGTYVLWVTIRGEKDVIDKLEEIYELFSTL